MPTVAISSDFLTAYARIPKAQQKKVRDFITRFELNPTAASINYEALTQARDKRVRTVRIDLAYRAVVLHPERGDVYVLVWVDHHDEAMDWACRRVFEVNPATGALQVIDTEAVEALVSTQTPSTPSKPLEAYGPFETFADDDLLRTGIPRPLLPAVKVLTSAENLEELKPYLPEEAYEALFWIGHYGYSVQQALDEVGSKLQKTDPDDIVTALSHPDSQRRFARVKSSTELVEMLNAPLAKWRVFLHPSQARLARGHFSGPAQVLGGAGTGKTVAAMHRVCYLSSQVFTAPTDRILFTTFTRNLAHNIENNLRNLCPETMNRIEVVNLHRWAVNFLRAQQLEVEIASNEEIEVCWRNAFSAVGTGQWDEAFFQSEWEQVVQAQGVTNKADYLQALRTGRRVRLTRKDRAEVWEVFDEFKRELAALSKIEWIEVIRQTRLYLSRSGNILPYRAIVVDETQDLHAEELKLIRQMVPPGDNDIFLVGDAHQRIYGRPVVLSQCGLNVIGRSRKLKINYRTTEEIKEWSVGVLRGQTFDNLDGGLDNHAEGYYSLLSGESPVVRNFPSLSEETKFLIETIQELSKLAEPETICLVARTHRQLEEDYFPALAQADLDYLHLQPDTDETEGTGLRVATMHRVKGLEFRHVLIAGVNAGIIPLEFYPSDTGDDFRLEAERRERCLLHVAATRARDSLTITSYGVPSRFLKVLGS